MPGTGLQAFVIRFALRFRGIIVALAVLLVVYGIYSLDHASYDAFPEFAPPQVDVQTEAPGFSSEEIETLVTRPIEEAIGGVPGLERIASNSIEGLSDIKVYFDPSSDVYRDREQVAERLSLTAAQLPAGVGTPAMTPLTSSAATVLVIGLTSKSRSLMQLRTIAKWTVRPRLLAVRGVAGVEIFGGDERSTQILVDPDRLVRFGLGFDEVLRAARAAVRIRGAGFVSTPNQRLAVRTEVPSASPSEIARTVVARRAGGSVRLGDVARVLTAPEPAIGGAAIMGRPGVVINIDEQYGADTLQTTKGIEAALADLRPALQEDGADLHPALFRQANFITVATRNLGVSLAIGAVLVTAVLLLFLFDLRSAAICCSAIPLSLLAAVVVLQQSGITLNTMTLGGLAIALGEVADDAVIGVENIARRLRENKRRDFPRPAVRVVFDATFEVRSAVVYATFAVILVFLPVVTLSGVAGRLFAPLGITYISAVLASLVVAVTITPALSLLLLPQRTRRHEPPVLHWTRRHYERALRRVIERPRLAMMAALLLTAGAAALLPLFGARFLPDLQEGHFILHMTAMPGTSITESLRMGTRVTAALAGLPFVRSVAQRAGRAELAAAGDSHGSHHSELEVDLKPVSGTAAASAKSEILRQLAHFPGVTFVANTFLTERVDETFSGYSSPVAVDVYGSDLNAIDNVARRVATVLRQIPGATSVEMLSPQGLPQLTIRLRRPDLERWGFDPAQVLDTLRTVYQGEIVGQTYEGERVFDVVVRLMPRQAENVAALRQLLLRAPDGTYVPLWRIADIGASSGRYAIEHQGGRRLQPVTLDVAGRDLAGFEAAARRAIASKVKLPPGTYIEFSGAAEGQAKARRELLLKSFLVAVGIVLLLSVVTRNRQNLCLALANLPFTFVGGVAAVFLAGGVLSLGSLVGFVTLFGITLRNSMMMIAHYEHLVAEEGWPWNRDTALRGAADRLAAVLMTSLVTGLGLLPLAIGMNTPGREVEGPMALVILGGLFTSTALNLVLLPTFALRWGRFEQPTPESDPVEHRRAAK